MTISTTTLKNAARALEHDLWTDSDGANYLVKDGAILRRWEPENSSDHAFELMVRLRLDVNYFPGFGEVHASDEGGHNCRMCAYTGDLASDTRRAITECAAIIGETLICQ